MRLTIDTLEALCVHVSFGVTYLGHDGVVDVSQFPKEVVVLACVGKELRLYSAFEGRLLGKLECKDMINSAAMSCDGTLVAVACEGGMLYTYKLNGLPCNPPPPASSSSPNDEGGEEKKEEETAMEDKVVYAVTEFLPLAELKGHEKDVCSVAFRPTSHIGGKDDADTKYLLASSAKDGTCREWEATSGKCVAMMACTIPDSEKQQQPKKNARAAMLNKQVLVRGVAYSPCGNFLYTIASGRRGKAFLGKWQRVTETQKQQQKQLPPFLPWDNSCVSDVPVSAMSINKDGTVLALGNVEGEVLFIGVEDGNRIKSFSVHDLPVTCISARPANLQYTSLRSKGKKLVIDAVSVSADNKMSFITLQKERTTLFGFIRGLFKIIVLIAIMKYCFDECEEEIMSFDVGAAKHCLVGSPPGFVLEGPLH